MACSMTRAVWSIAAKTKMSVLPPTTTARRRSPRRQTVRVASNRNRSTRSELSWPIRVRSEKTPSVRKIVSPRNRRGRTPVIRT